MSDQPFEQLAEELTHLPDVTRTRMFGREAMKVAGKVFVVGHPDEIVIKIGQERVDELVAAGAATPFNPGRPGRKPMTGWAVVPAPADGDPTAWVDLAVEAHAFVAGST